MSRRALAAAGIGSVLIAATTPALAAPGANRPSLDWRPCDRAITPGLECGTLQVPRDYGHPRRAPIHLALIRHRTTDPKRRVGTLFFNPGGPGCCATTFVPDALKLGLFPRAIRERFDIVSWDPRGVGESTAVQCFATQRREQRFFAKLPQGFPVGASRKHRWIRLFDRFGKRCARRNRGLLRHVSTADTARDMNRIRRALGSARLNYLGISYGTFLGATYANLFPDRVRAMVLDGNLNPRSWIHRRRKSNGGRFLGTELRLRTDRGTARTLDAFLDLCGRAERSDCAFSAGTAAATHAKFAELLRRVRKHPKASGTSYGALLQATESDLEATQPGWGALAQRLRRLWAGDAQLSGRTALVDRMLAPTGASDRGRRYSGPEQQYAIYCSESPNPRAAAFWSQARIGLRRSGPVGRYWSWLPEPCGSWRAAAADRYKGPWDAPTPNPVLVIGNAYDPSTPYRESKAIVRQLADARLLSVDGYGHTEFMNPSSCAVRYESRYLVGLRLPPAGTSCPQDFTPFAGGAHP
jgi:pimeloyl-ACP methyl ester carboxylesterase